MKQNVDLFCLNKTFIYVYFVFINLILQKYKNISSNSGSTAENSFIYTHTHNSIYLRRWTNYKNKFDAL